MPSLGVGFPVIPSPPAVPATARSPPQPVLPPPGGPEVDQPRRARAAGGRAHPAPLGGRWGRQQEAAGGKRREQEASSGRSLVLERPREP